MSRLHSHTFGPEFVVAKPRKEPRPGEIERLTELGRLIGTRKRDGYGAIVVTSRSVTQPVSLYTRGITNITAKFPELADAIASYDIPPGTIIPCEIHFIDKDGGDNFAEIARFMSSGEENAIAHAQVVGSPSVTLFTPLFAWGNCQIYNKFIKRNELLRGWLDKASSPLVYGLQILSGGFDDWKRSVLSEKWEGLVLYDKSGLTTFRTDGNHANPPRAEESFTWKPEFEDDYIATHCSFGAGRKAGLASKIHIAKRDPAQAEYVSCGEVPLFSQEHKIYFGKAQYPLVVQVQYEMRFASGALRTAQVQRVRNDKLIDECTI